MRVRPLPVGHASGILLVHSFEHHQNLFRATRSAAEIQMDILHQLAGTGGRNGADRKALGKHAIFAGRIKPFAQIDFFLILNVVDRALAAAFAVQGAVNV